MIQRLLLVLAAAVVGSVGAKLWRQSTAGAPGGRDGEGGRGTEPGSAGARVVGTPRSAPRRAPAGASEARVVNGEPPGDTVAAQTVTRRCAAITRGGSRCTRDSEAGSDYCWQHGG